MKIEQNLKNNDQEKIIMNEFVQADVPFKVTSEENKRVRKNKNLAILAFIVSAGFLIFSIKPISKFWLVTLIIVLITSFFTFSIKNIKLYKIAKLLFIIEIGVIIAIIVTILLAIILSGPNASW